MFGLTEFTRGVGFEFPTSEWLYMCRNFGSTICATRLVCSGALAGSRLACLEKFKRLLKSGSSPMQTRFRDVAPCPIL